MKYIEPEMEIVELESNVDTIGVSDVNEEGSGDSLDY